MMGSKAADWVSPAKAFILVADAYRAIQPGSADTASDWARNAVLCALSKGQCRARAIEASLYLGKIHAVLAFVLTKSPAPLSVLDANNHLSMALWQNFQLCGQLDDQDWENGNLEFSGVEPITKQPINGRAFGVEVERMGLPLVGLNSAYATKSGCDQSGGVNQRTEQEFRDWISRQPLMSADKAFEIYKLVPNKYIIKRDEFRKYWKLIHKTKRGRPAG